MNRQEIHPRYEKFLQSISNSISEKMYNKLMSEGDFSDIESSLLSYLEDNSVTSIFDVINRRNTIMSVLIKCQELRYKLSVLNRRLLKVKAENRRLRKLLDGLKSIEIED